MRVAICEVMDIGYGRNKDFASFILFDEEANRNTRVRIRLADLVKINPAIAQAARINPFDEYQWVFWNYPQIAIRHESHA